MISRIMQTIGLIIGVAVVYFTGVGICFIGGAGVNSYVYGLWAFPATLVLAGLCGWVYSAVSDWWAWVKNG